MALTVPKIAIMTQGGSPLGLAVAALEALHLYTTLQVEEEAWEAYEEDIEDAADEARGSTMRIEAGEGVPFAATVVEGTGNALRDGAQPQPAVPGSQLPAGTTLYGGGLHGDAASSAAPADVAFEAALLLFVQHVADPGSILSAFAMR